MNGIAFYLTIITFACIGCSGGINHEQERNSELTGSFRKYLTSKGIDTIMTFDSIIVIRVDTVTPKSEALMLADHLAAKAEAAGRISSLKGQLYKLAMEEAILNASMFGKSNYITQIAKQKADEAKGEYDQSLNEIKRYLNDADSIVKVATGSLIDSTTFLGYKAVFKINSANKHSGVASVDTAAMRFNKLFQVLEYPK